jgi:TonB family protein
MTSVNRKVLIAAIALSGLIGRGALYGQVYSPGSGVTPPRVVRSVPMPRLAARVILECVVQQDGRLSATKIVRSSTAADEEAVLSAVAQWQFEAGARDGKPVAVRFYVSFAPAR